MPRRRDGIYHRKDGLWEARYVKEVDLAGKKKYGSVYGHSYKEAREKRQDELYADAAVKKRAGIFEYILGGCTDCRLLELRVFEESTKKAVYAQQTDEAKKHDRSNCPLCALGSDNNARRIWKYSEMDADHVTAWSKGGKTDISNCQMLCITHNRAKGNK